MRKDATKIMTVDELADAAHVTREIMLRRIAGVLERRPWYRRAWFRLRAWWALREAERG